MNKETDHSPFRQYERSSEPGTQRELVNNAEMYQEKLNSQILATEQPGM